MDRFLGWIGWHPFRCQSCQKRFFAFATARDRAGVRQRRTLSVAYAAASRLARG
jgi:hypothetical protein